MPAKCEELLGSVGLGDRAESLDALRWGDLEPGRAITLDAPPFPRHEMPAFDQPAPVVTETPGAEPAGDKVSYDHFAKIDLRVGTVLSAEVVEKSDKLLRLKVDLGDAEPRQVIAGIAKTYRPDELPGRQFLFVANLEPRKVFGNVSEAMILAAHDDDGLAVLSPGRILTAGAKVS
jgi:methionyl-tRNA synthetase